MFMKRRQIKTEGKNKDNYNDIIDIPQSMKVINKKHHLFLSQAYEVAKKSNMLQKHGAIIVYRNEIIASGCNYMCNHLYNNYSIHAEISAISQMFYNKKLLEYCDIYVVRISNTYENCLRNSKPCKNCSNFIKKYNLRNAYYSTNYIDNHLYIQ